MNIRYLHPRISLTRTLTSRLATTGYPVLGLPKHSEEGRQIRGLVRAPAGYVLYEADYSQIEMRTMAELSQDPGLLEAYRNGEDIHARTAEKVFGVPKEKQDKSKHRLPAKTGNFGVLMGLQEKGLTEQVHRYGNLDWSADCQGCKYFKAAHDRGCDSVAFFREFFRAYPGVEQFQHSRRRDAERTGVAYGMWGMEWFLPGVWAVDEMTREQTLRQAHALPIQEGAQRLIKLAMAAVYGRLPGQTLVRPCLQIHDSLVFVVKTSYLQTWHTVVKSTMEHVAEWSIPIIAEGSAGPSWLQQEDL